MGSEALTLWSIAIRALETVGPVELLILFAIVAGLLLLGPSKIPELARGLGRAMGELKRGRQEVEREIQRDLLSDQADVAKSESPTPIIKAAQELGIPMGVRSEAEIKLDVVRAVDREEADKVISTAKVLGIGTEGLSLTEIKMRIIGSVAG